MKAMAGTIERRAITSSRISALSRWKLCRRRRDAGTEHAGAAGGGSGIKAVGPLGEEEGEVSIVWGQELIAQRSVRPGALASRQSRKSVGAASSPS